MTENDFQEREKYIRALRALRETTDIDEGFLYKNMQKVEDAAKVFLKALILKDKPELFKQELTVFDQGCILREWVSEYMPRHCQMNKVPDHNSIARLKLIADGLRADTGFLCGGLSTILQYVYTLFGMNSHTYNFGIRNVFTHVVVLLEVPTLLNNKTQINYYIQDPLLGTTYVDSQDRPLHFEEICLLLANKQHESIRMIGRNIPRVLVGLESPDREKESGLNIIDGQMQRTKFISNWQKEWATRKESKAWLKKYGFTDDLRYAILSFVPIRYRSPETPLLNLVDALTGHYSLPKKQRERKDIILDAFNHTCGSASSLSAFWEKNIYNGDIKESFQRKSDVCLFQATSRKDHIATPYFTIPAPDKALRIFSLEMQFPSAQREYFEWKLYAQNTKQEILALFGVSSSDIEIKPGLYRKRFYLFGEDTDIRLVFSSGDSLWVLMPLPVGMHLQIEKGCAKNSLYDEPGLNINSYD